jgi:hypothetical protein
MAGPFFWPTPIEIRQRPRAFFREFRYDPLIKRVVGSETSWQTIIRAS